MDDTLFPMGADQEKPKESGPKGAARLSSPNRAQIELRVWDCDRLIAADHPARSVWEFVEGVDLSWYEEGVGSVEGEPGRPATDPRVLMGLWLYATIEGVGSARALERLCERDVVYQWICGGVSVNYHTLSDFRVKHMEELDRILTESVAVLMAEGLVKMRRVAQDGLRVRASAGGNSFRGRGRLEELLKEAEEQVQRLREELEADPGVQSRREEEAQKRAKEERKKRIEAALRALPKVEARKAGALKKSKEPARLSTTDPEARVMKMGNGGMRPAYNTQLATDTESRIIVGVDVTNEASDAGLMTPMLDQMERRYGRRPSEILADTGYAAHREIKTATAKGCTVYAPVHRHRWYGEDPHEVLPKDSEAVAAWRRRMKTEDAARIYRQRASVAEWVNAVFTNMGLRQFLVRGIRKVRAVTLWYALAHNLLQSIRLRRASIAVA